MTFLNRVNEHPESFKNPSLTSRHTYLGNIDKFCDDFCPLLGGWFAKNHQLDPFRDSIKQSNRSLQGWVILQAAMDDIALVISELIKEGLESLNYNEVFAKSEIRMLHESEVLFHNNKDFFHFIFIMASYKFEHTCTCSMLFCCISLSSSDIHHYASVLGGQERDKI